VRTQADVGQPIKLVIIEGLVPQYDKTPQCGLWAIFTGIAAIKEIPVIVAPIQSWRAFVLGNGRLKRDEAKTLEAERRARTGKCICHTRNRLNELPA
jgi:hypothetical protein